MAGSGIQIEVVEPGAPNDPFAPKDQTGTSAPVSPVGTEQETVGSSVETAPVPGSTESSPSPQPATRESGKPPPTPPMVQVIPAGQPEQSVPVEETTAQTQEVQEVPKTEEEQEAETKKAEEVLQEKINSSVEGALRSQQSVYDRQASALTTRLEEAAQGNSTLTQKIRELETRDLTEEERQVVMDKFAQDDERTALDSYRSELDTFHKDLAIMSLMHEFRGYGVEEDALRALETPEEMQAFSLEAKATFLEKVLEEGKAAPAQLETPIQPTPPTTGTAATAAPAKPEPQVPAGATAPTDIGSSGAPEQPKGFSQGTTPKDLQSNLRDMGWDTVRVRRS